MFRSVITLFFIHCTCIFVTVHAYISLTVPKEVRYKKDNLTFSCLPSSDLYLASISDIILWKNTSKGWEEVIKVFSDTSTGHLNHQILWTNTDFRDRSVLVKALVFPSINSVLRLTIKAENVILTDGGTFRCSIHGNLYNGDKLKTFSTATNMEIITELNTEAEKTTKLSALDVSYSFFHLPELSRTKKPTTLPALYSQVLTDADTVTFSNDQALSGILLVYTTPLLTFTILMILVIIISCRYRQQKRLKDNRWPNQNKTVADILPRYYQRLRGSVQHNYGNTNGCICFYENHDTLDVKTQQHQEACIVCLYENHDNPYLKRQENEEPYSVYLNKTQETPDLKYQENGETYSVCLYENQTCRFNENQNTLDLKSQEMEEACSVNFYENQDTLDLKSQDLEEVYFYENQDILQESQISRK